MQRTIDGKDLELTEKDNEILAARREAYAVVDKLRRQARHVDHVVGRLPHEMRVRFLEEQRKVIGKTQRERGGAR